MRTMLRVSEQGRVTTGYEDCDQLLSRESGGTGESLDLQNRCQFELHEGELK
jgi:hypothetical protein